MGFYAALQLTHQSGRKDGDGILTGIRIRVIEAQKNLHHPTEVIERERQAAEIARIETTQARSTSQITMRRKCIALW